MKNWCKFDPFTGERTNFKTLDELPLRHREGIFLEDFIHDWNIRPGQKFDYYSRVSGQGQLVKLLIEFEMKE